MRIIRLPIVLFICFFPVPGLVAQNPTGLLPAGENIYDYRNSLLYAKFLLKSGEYATAALELERVVFMNPSDDSAKYLLITAYQNGENYSKGTRRAEELFAETFNMPQNVSVTYGKMLLLNKENEKLGKFTRNSNGLSQRDKAFFHVNIHLFEMKWQQAGQFWDNSDSSLTATFPRYNQLLREALSLKYKKPAFATGLSVLVPGAGKIYTKNWFDGVLSFITIGSLSYQAYRGFSKKGMNSAYGWIFGSLALGFYSGNIYGSFKAAKKYNSTLDAKILSDAEKELHNY